jgi:hypothetical protein
MPMLTCLLLYCLLLLCLLCVLRCSDERKDPVFLLAKKVAN